MPNRRGFLAVTGAAAAVFGTVKPSFGWGPPRARFAIPVPHSTEWKIVEIPFQAATAEFGAPYRYEGIDGYFLGWTPEWAAAPTPDNSKRWRLGTAGYELLERERMPNDDTPSSGVPQKDEDIRKLAQRIVAGDLPMTEGYRLPMIAGQPYGWDMHDEPAPGRVRHKTKYKTALLTSTVTYDEI